MIKLSKQSEQYIRETLDKYKPVDGLPADFTGRTILHLYPTQDTMQENGLVGFEDALMFDIKVYVPKRKVVYTVEWRDQVELKVPADIRIFKDGSTMIIIDKPFTFGYYQSLEVNPR